MPTLTESVNFALELYRRPQDFFSGKKNLSLAAVLILGALSSNSAAEEVIAFDMVNGASHNLTGFTNPWDGAFSSSGDGFQKYQRGVSSSIPFAVLDDSLSIFPPDGQGIVKEGNTEPFFGVVDTINSQNPSGAVAATWEFDVSGATGLVLSIDMGAMGDFESSDSFEWTYSIDGGPELTAFASTVDEAGSNTYTLEGGAVFTLNDPMLMQGTILTNDLASFSTPVVGTGSTLTLTLTATFNGGTEAVAFQNIVIKEGGVTTAGLAFDMVGSTSLNLTSFTNPWSDAFSSAGDGFQKYQRGVSATIPFAVLDDSLSIFPADSQGIIKEGNTDIFFGAADTINAQNPSGDVTATWTFDVSAASLGLVLSIDMGAMGDFESSDPFQWTYSIDGGPTLTAFSNAVDEAGSNTYTLEGGGMFTLNDPMLMQETILTNDLTTFGTALVGTGSTLTLTLSLTTNGSGEGIVFQNIIVSDADVPPPPPSDLEIFEIQGSGSASPVDGNVITTNDNVVTAVAPNGFFMQTPTARGDGDVDTSDGIFVFTGAAPGVAVGDNVDVTGEVDEFFGFTELTSATVTPDGVETVPNAVTFNAGVPSPDPTAPSCSIEFECYEGMLVTIPDGTVTGPNQRFGSDPIAEVYITAAPARTFREPGIEFPGTSGFPEWDGNPEVFELDPNKLGLTNQVIPAGSSFSATGVIGFEFGGYELWPTELTFDEAPLPVPVRSRDAGEFTVGSLNLFRLFNDIDDPEEVISDDPDDPARDDFVVSTVEYQRRLTKFSAYIRDVLEAPDILAVQEVESLKVLGDLADQIELDDPSVVYVAHLLEGNDIGTIDVGFLTRERIQVDALTQVDPEMTFENPLTLEQDILHDRPPLLLEGSCQSEFGAFPISVMSVHNRSLGGIDGSEGERVRKKRLLQAGSIASKVQTLQVADADTRLVVIGDFNAFEFTDGYVDALGVIIGEFDPTMSLVCDEDTSLAACNMDLVEPNLDLPLTDNERYSFIFRGNAQALDHALTTQKLADEVTGVEYGRGNADAAVDLINDDGSVVPANKPLRSSDHDGLVVYISKDKDADGVPNDADVCPATVIPENVPTKGLGTNRFALTNGDGLFDTNAPKGKGPRRSFTLGDTAGCSCEQIIAAQGLGNGHTKFGCSISAMQDWVSGVKP